MSPCLIDTGPLVAYLNRRDRSHDRVVSFLGPFRGELHTTSAVITEAMHFVSSSPAGPMALVNFVIASGTQVHGIHPTSELRRAVALMEKYADTPMDYADATLVLLGEKMRIDKILTLDRRGFSVFRTARGEAFSQVLDGV